MKELGFWRILIYFIIGMTIGMTIGRLIHG